MNRTIGWLKPGAVDRTLEEVFAILPPDVELSILTSTHSLQMVGRDHFDAAAYARQQDAVLDLVQQLDEYAHPDYVAVTGDLIQAAMGLTWNLALQDTLQQVTGRPAGTSMTAAGTALTSLGVRRIAVASPYRPDQNAAMRRYLEDAGFTVLAIDGYACPSIRAIRALPEAAPLELGRKVFQAAAGAEAVYLPCPVWRTGAAVERLEQACGVPVVTNIGSFIWAALKAMGHPGGVKGAGSLLAGVVN